MKFKWTSDEKCQKMKHMYKTHNVAFAIGSFPPRFGFQSVKGLLGIAVAQVQHRSHPPGPLDSKLSFIIFLSFSFELRVSPASIRSWLPVWTQKITLSNLNTKNKTSQVISLPTPNFKSIFHKLSKTQSRFISASFTLVAAFQARCHFEVESWITVNSSWQTEDLKRHVAFRAVFLSYIFHMPMFLSYPLFSSYFQYKSSHADNADKPAKS